MTTTNRHCPLCQQPNQCGMLANADQQPETCWCFTIDIPAALLQQVPIEQRDRACICQACVDRYHQHTEQPTQAPTSNHHNGS